MLTDGMKLCYLPITFLLINFPPKWMTRFSFEAWEPSPHSLTFVGRFRLCTPLTKDKWGGDKMFSFMSTRTNCWTNSRVVSDLRRHDSHITSLWCMTWRRWARYDPALKRPQCFWNNHGCIYKLVATTKKWCEKGSHSLELCMWWNYS